MVIKKISRYESRFCVNEIYQNMTETQIYFEVRKDV